MKKYTRSCQKCGRYCKHLLHFPFGDRFWCAGCVCRCAGLPYRAYITKKAMGYVHNYGGRCKNAAGPGV